MLSYVTSALRYAALALCAALSCVGLASVTEKLVTHHFARQALAKVGSYGESLAKWKAESSYMAGVDERPDTVSSGLTKQSNGFIQKVLASISGEEARIGVGNGLTV